MACACSFRKSKMVTRHSKEWNLYCWQEVAFTLVDPKGGDRNGPTPRPNCFHICPKLPHVGNPGYATASFCRFACWSPTVHSLHWEVNQLLSIEMTTLQLIPLFGNITPFSSEPECFCLSLVLDLLYAVTAAAWGLSIWATIQQYCVVLCDFYWERF